MVVSVVVARSSECMRVHQQYVKSSSQFWLQKCVKRRELNSTSRFPSSAAHFVEKISCHSLIAEVPNSEPKQSAQSARRYGTQPFSQGHKGRVCVQQQMCLVQRCSHARTRERSASDADSNSRRERSER